MAICSIYYYKSKQIKHVFGTNPIITGTFLSLVFVFVPIYGGIYPQSAVGVLKIILGAIHNALRCFILDGEIDFVQRFTDKIEPARLGAIYSIWAAILYVIAPILTFGVVLSFFGDVTARFRLYSGLFKREIYVFSALNEKSISLARSIIKKRIIPLLIFCDTPKEGDLLDIAHNLNAICFRKEITDIKLKYRRETEVFLFSVCEDESKALIQSIDLINDYRMQGNFRFYTFSTLPECDLIINSALGEDAKIKVFRINHVQSFIYRTLYEYSIFEKAVPNGGIKKITAVILGLGYYGTEMLKSLCWCGQMDGYELDIHAFDQSPNASSRFTADCPGLMAHSSKGDSDEDHYSITIHNGLDYETMGFREAIFGLPEVTFVFVALGSDEKNIDAALDLRSILEGQGSYADILAVVYDSKKSKLIKKNPPVNFKNQPMDITLIGDLEKQYSYETIICSELEQKALELHCKWGDETSFYRFDYNYRSSMACAIHAKRKAQCAIPKENIAKLNINAGMRICAVWDISMALCETIGRSCILIWLDTTL